MSEIQSCNRKLETVEKWNCISGIYSDWEKLNTDLSALNSTIDSVTKEIMEKSNRRAEYDRKKEEAFKTFTKSELEYEKFKAAVPEKTDDTCPTCGQKLPVGKIKELEERLSRQKKELSELEKHMKEKESVLISATKAVNSYTEERIKPIESRRENLIALQSELKERIEKTGITDSDTALKAKAEAYLEDKVFDRKNTLESERDNIAGRISKLKEEIASIDNSMHEARIRSLEEELSNVDTLLSSAKEDLGGLKKERDILERNRKIEERTRAELKEKQHLQSNYEIVEKAFGANGIQALEMEAMAPDVAEVTNSILQSAYGDKFKVSFQTLRLGSKKELIEDFSIMVENTETGSVKPLEWLSGGEGTWIKEALFHAFSVVRMRNTKFSFRTNFLDEADGALDHDSKLRYLKMIEKAHIESGVDKTILITHSQELKDVIEQKIEL
jgi:DNA repair exonuclease SbcCD ATPase subunit